MSTAYQPANILEPEAERDLSLATKHEVDLMIRARLMQFHRALVDRDQINPVPPAAGPKVAET